MEDDIEYILLPEKINGVGIEYAVFPISTEIKTPYPPSSSNPSVKYTIEDDEVTVFGVSKTYEPDMHSYQVETLSKSELKDIFVRINQYIENPGEAVMLTRKELTAICYSFFRVMDHIEAFSKKKYTKILKSSVGKMIIDVYAMSDEKIDNGFEGKTLSEWVIGNCENPIFKSHADAKKKKRTKQFIKCVKFLEQAIFDESY